MRNITQRRPNGFTVLELLIVIGVIAIIASLAIPNFTASKKAANESSAVASMRALADAEENFRVSQTPPQYGQLSKLKTAGIINPALGSGSKSGYTFITFGVPTAHTYAFTGIPQSGSGDRWFYVDQSGVVRVSTTGPADPTSAPID